MAKYLNNIQGFFFFLSFFRSSSFYCVWELKRDVKIHYTSAKMLSLTSLEAKMKKDPSIIVEPEKKIMAQKDP